MIHDKAINYYCYVNSFQKLYWREKNYAGYMSTNDMVDEKQKIVILVGYVECQTKFSSILFCPHIINILRICFFSMQGKGDN